MSLSQDEVPGTVLLVDVNHCHEAEPHARTREVLLVPPPTQFCRDPLNWSRKKKLYQLLLGCMMIVATAYSETCQGPAWTIISEQRNVSLDNMNGGSGLNCLILGFGNLLWIPVALKLGRKFVFVFTLYAGVPVSYWNGSFRGVAEWYASNLFLGLTNSIYYALVQLTIFDMFFHHEHGVMIALAILAQNFGSFLGALLGGIITNKLGWPWGSYMFSIAAGLLATVFLFTYDDTTFPRQVIATPTPVTDQSIADPDFVAEPNIAELPCAPSSKDKSLALQRTNTSINDGTCYDVPRTYRQLLNPIHCPAEDRTTFWGYFRRPFLVVFFPNILLAGIINAFAQCSGFLYFNTLAEITQEQPYNFSTIQTGLFAVATLIGALIGMLTGWWSDSLVIWLARRNNGYREPEQRLWALLPCLIYTVIGYLAYGWGAQTEAPWIVIGIGLCFLVAQQGAISNITVTYAMECFEGVSGETVTLLACMAAPVNFAISWTTQTVIDATDYGRAFTIWLAISIASLLCVPVLMIWGKNWRKKSAPKYYRLLKESFSE